MLLLLRIICISAYVLYRTYDGKLALLKRNVLDALLSANTRIFLSHLLTCLQVARNLGKTLRAFQPTIRELQVGSWYVVAICLMILLHNVIWFSAHRMYQGSSGALLNEKLELMRFPPPRIIGPQPRITTNNLPPTQVSWFPYIWSSFQWNNAHFCQRTSLIWTTLENHACQSNTTDTPWCIFSVPTSHL